MTRLARSQHLRLTSGLPRATQLPPIPELPLVNTRKPVPTRFSIGLDKRTAASKLRRRGHVMAFLVAGAIGAAAASYFVFASGQPGLDFIDVPTSASSETHVTAGNEAEREYKVTKSQPPSPQVVATDDRTTGDTNAMPGSTSADRGSPGGSAAITTTGHDTKPLSEKDSQFFAETAHDSTCFASASAVRQNHPEAWPSWTLRAPGHQGTKCWYAATRAKAHDHRGEMAPQKQAVETLGSHP